VFENKSKLILLGTDFADKHGFFMKGIGGRSQSLSSQPPADRMIYSPALYPKGNKYYIRVIREICAKKLQKAKLIRFLK